MTIERNKDEEKRQKTEFSHIQKEIYDLFSRTPKSPVIHIKSITQTSLIIKWEPLELYFAELRGIDVYRNGIKLAVTPSPSASSVKLSGLDMNHEYELWIVVRTSAGSFTSNKESVKTHTIDNLTGLNPTFGLFNNPSDAVELVEIISRIGASYTEDLSTDNTHLICTLPRGPKFETAKELNIPVVSPEFLKACEANGKIMPSHLFYMQAE